MQVNNFSQGVLSTHKMFFLLKHLPKNATEVDIWIQTPTGYESVDFIDVFKMADGSLLAAWVHPLQKLGLQNLVAFADGVTQVLNLYPVERIVDIYDRPLDSTLGTFNFTASRSIDNADWRCDRGYYGPKAFDGEISQPLITNPEDVVAFESFFSVAGTGHLIYIESSGKQELAVEKLNNSIIPITGRTLQEVLRLIYEWSVLADEPFNSTDEVAVCAKQYITALKLSENELSVLNALPPMQIAQFLSGSETARVRPTNLEPLSKEVLDIVLDRMASSSLSFIISRNPEIWDYASTLSMELEELEQGIARFKEYYGIPEHTDMENWADVQGFADLYQPKQSAYVHNQLRHFTNKKKVLNGELSRP